MPRCLWLPLSGEKACKNGQCISAGLFCNYEPGDCFDGSDEDGCELAFGDCNFEGGLCGWEDHKQDQFDWTRHQGYTGTGSTGPRNDHTRQSPKG